MDSIRLQHRIQGGINGCSIDILGQGDLHAGCGRLSLRFSALPRILRWDASLLAAYGVLELPLLSTALGAVSAEASWTATGHSLLLDENRRCAGSSSFSSQLEASSHELHCLTQLHRASINLEIGEVVTEAAVSRPIVLIPRDERLQLVSGYAFATSRGACYDAFILTVAECSEPHGLDSIAELALQLTMARSAANLDFKITLGPSA